MKWSSMCILARLANLLTGVLYLRCNAYGVFILTAVSPMPRHAATRVGVDCEADETHLRTNARGHSEATSAVDRQFPSFSTRWLSLMKQLRAQALVLLHLSLHSWFDAQQSLFLSFVFYSKHFEAIRRFDLN